MATSRKRGAGGGGPRRARPSELARKPWRSLSEADQGRLRSWRGKKAAETRATDYYGGLASRLGGEHGKRERALARAELRERGTRGMARHLRSLGWEDSDIESAFAFWFYAP